MYKRWVRKEIKDEDESDETEVPMNKSMGLVQTVDEARTFLEKIFKSGSHYH
jgi:hypothetical protein